MTTILLIAVGVALAPFVSALLMGLVCLILMILFGICATIVNMPIIIKQVFEKWFGKTKSIEKQPAKTETNFDASLERLDAYNDRHGF